MGGPSDKNDKTQMLSDSQVVEVKPAPGSDKNDRSVWKGMVVGADEFALPPVKQPSRAPWIVAAVLGAGAIGGGLYWFVLRDRGSAAVAVPDARPQPDAARPAPDAAPPDAAPPDAAPADAPPPEDAGVADAAAADAGVPAAKPVPKKKPGPKKKPVPKKKAPAKPHT